jgi:prepilin-type N-terminal cleavage/methylation domain-containing protein/prepilin-type processing-associated H-X9-DG protein
MKAKGSEEGFTLVELLVTIAVIGVLAGLLLPALAGAAGKAKRVTCFNGMRQWALGTRLYANDNDGILPREEAIDGPNSWDMTTFDSNKDVWYNCVPAELGVNSVSQYALSVATQMEFYKDRLFTCPSANFDPVASQTYPNFSISMNSKLINGDTNVSFNLVEDHNASLTAMFVDSGVPGEPKFYKYQSTYNGQPKAFASRFSGRHGRAGNIAFFDGHVQTMPGEKVVCTNDADLINRGRDIDPPVDVIWYIETP